MQMKKWLWLAGIIVLVGTLVYIKWDMAQNRRMASQETDTAAAETPTKAADRALKQTLTNNAPSSGSQTDPQSTQQLDPMAPLKDLFKNVPPQLLGNTSPPPATQPGDAKQPANPLTTLLDVVPNAGRLLDQPALKATEISDEEEMAYGDKLDKQICREMRPTSNAKTLSRLESLAKPLIEQRRRKAIRYQFRILESSKINAFACAGGHVYLTTTFMKRFSSDEELAMTLGHEIAHIDLKHAVQKVQLVNQGQKFVGNLANLAQPLYAFLTTPYERDKEFEADAVGFDACRKAGWESSKLLSLYEGLIKLEQEQAKNRGDGSVEPATGLENRLENRLGNYFNAHPPTKERLDRLKAKS